MDVKEDSRKYLHIKIITIIIIKFMQNACVPRANKQAETVIMFQFHCIWLWHGMVWHGMTWLPVWLGGLFYHKHSKFLCLNFTCATHFHFFFLGTFYWYNSYCKAPASGWRKMQRHCEKCYTWNVNIVRQCIGHCLLRCGCEKIEFAETETEINSNHLYEILRTNWSWN